MKQITALGLIASVAPDIGRAMPSATKLAGSKSDSLTFLFQGDSITDGNRTRNDDWNHVMGHGYQYIIAARLWYEFPDKRFLFFNRGISGNKVPDLADRWQKDAIDLKPNVLSILIGINDIIAFINGNKKFSAQQYEDAYSAVLQQTRQALPNVQLVLCQPFILAVGKVTEKWKEYSVEIEKRQEIVRRLSTDHDGILVDFQKSFNKAVLRGPAEYWIWDGLHPMPAGHELMAREWMQQAGKKLKFIKK